MTDPAPSAGPASASSTAPAPAAPAAAPRRTVRQRVRELDWRKAMKYSAVSVIAVPITQIILIIFHYWLGYSGVVSNFIAVCATAVPAYVLNRYWVWGKNDKNKFFTEILPFWLMTLLGLAFSTLFVAWADRVFTDRPLMVNVANAAGFGIVWVFKFFILDRAMFGRHHHFSPEVEEELIEREEEHEAHHHHPA